MSKLQQKILSDKEDTIGFLENEGYEVTEIGRGYTIESEDGEDKISFDTFKQLKKFVDEYR